MIAIIDYGVGNLFSLTRSLEYIGEKSIVTRDLSILEAADHIILPGVGAFGDAIEKLEQLELVAPIQQLAASGKHFLGICLGMQLLFETSEEFGNYRGLGLIPGKIISMTEAFQKQGIDLKVPQIGWNQLEILQEDCPLIRAIQQGDYVYYVHSFYGADCEDSLVAVSDYGVKIPGIVQKENVMGTQFHPEKSGDVGLKILKAFAEVGK
ncbi:imidazole glycerol phosphate synthase subunit HisH [Candidatus Enterococcus ferrettii]|uniref:Imidazole glycerol phosphate synthase subunit HisH n=1 Tax=Candidatus Enterococcus ferrettii TaxID=2815324 RepID=A0ABV0EVT2_9ENTE|nr:imidazole glycerol phosphate synthase subunit HisH [Enterococcus sp. 665A]MBO1342489.1 imidazole glycerol phosphate synthase subunit HisH [Enterococcus sp. 665A]